jgi:hypothetical protein
MRALRLVLSLAVLALGACSSSVSSTSPTRTPPGVGPSTGAPGASSGGAPGPTLAEALRACPVTAPNGSAPPGEGRDRLFLGRDGLWTTLWPHGLVLVPKGDIAPDGTLGMKFPWWRGPGVRGFLRITGNEVGSGLAVSARTAGYGRTGFNASAIFFPAEGCYRITGRAGGAEMTFVTLVRTCAVLPELSATERRRSADWCG